MIDPSSRLVNRNTPPGGALWYVGMGIQVLGFLVFLSNFVITPMHWGQKLGFDQPEPVPLAVMLALGGLVLIVAGRLVRRFGLGRPSVTSPAFGPARPRRDGDTPLRPGGGSISAALEEGGAIRRRLSVPPNAPTPIIRIRCRSCQALNDDANKFCGQCGQPL